MTAWESYKLAGQGAKLSTKRLYHIAKDGGWQLYSPKDSIATTREEMIILLADTHLGYIVFKKQGKDNWARLDLIEEQKEDILEHMEKHSLKYIKNTENCASLN